MDEIRAYDPFRYKSDIALDRPVGYMEPARDPLDLLSKIYTALTAGTPGFTLAELPSRRASNAPGGKLWSLRRVVDLMGIPYTPARSSLRAPEYAARRRKAEISGVSRRRNIADQLPGGQEYLYDTLKQRYQELAKQWHPDVPGGDTEKMKLLNDAMDFVERRYGPNRLLSFPRY